MVHHFLKWKEYEGYQMDMMILKTIFFRKETKKHTYLIKVLEGAYYEAVIFQQRKEDKHYERISYEKAEKSVKELALSINAIVHKANEHYESILPFYEHKMGTLLFRVTSMAEDMPMYKKDPLAYPRVIYVWMDIWKEKKKIGEIQWVVQNKTEDKHYATWEIGTKKISYQQGECGYKEVECLRKTLMERLNKPNRLRHLF